MKREKSHSEDKEPIFDRFLGNIRFRKIKKYIPKNSRVLDLGCGFNGDLLHTIGKDISYGIGLDISVNKNLLESNISLMNCDLDNTLPFADNEFDIVISLASLEHLKYPYNCLLESFRILKPGGKLILTTPSKYGKPVLELLAIIGMVSKQEIKDHKNYFDKKILLDFCKSIGFSEYRHQYFQLGLNNFLIAIK